MRVTVRVAISIAYNSVECQATLPKSEGDWLQ
jgi:hypothetical protein